MDMTKYEFIKKEFKGVYGSIKMYIDGTNFHFIDVDDDRFEGFRSVTASCGCCDEMIDYDSGLSYELEYMDDDDFQELIAELNKIKLK